MDGWETRRRRNGGYDHAIVKLGLAGEIRGVDIDTGFLPVTIRRPRRSKPACESAPDESTDWTDGRVDPLQGDSHHYFEIDNPARFTHVRLNIFPDGGVARLRIHGQSGDDGWVAT